MEMLSCLKVGEKLFYFVDQVVKSGEEFGEVAFEDGVEIVE